MTTPSDETQIYGLLAEFKDADALVDAATRARDAGFARVDAYAPFSVPGFRKPSAIGATGSPSSR